MKTCTDCGGDFEKKTTKRGRVNQCDDCSASDSTKRYVGYNDGTLNKSTNISVYRGSDPNVLKALLKKQQNVV
jgi:hypothetical protein